ncbi:40S ribosomal protein S18 [Hordeum vulgare]|nr:40S ribosomal protein S18 [Hordeum vulgare]
MAIAESDAHLREPGQRSRHPVCDACMKPLRVCLCGRLRGPAMDTAVGVTMLEHPTEAHHPLSSVRVAHHSSTAYNFSPPPREAMASSPTLLSPQYTHPSPPHTRRILPPPPSAASPSMTSDRLRLRVRHGPSPTQAKFGKFDAADAPTETVPSASAISEVKGAVGQVVLEEDRSGMLPIQGNIARLVVDIFVPLTWFLALFVVSVACRRIWRARYDRAADPSAGVPQPEKGAGRGLGAVENTPGHTHGRDWPGLDTRAGDLSSEEMDRLMMVVANQRLFRVSDWFLNRKKDYKDGLFSQVKYEAKCEPMKCINKE